MDDRYTIEIRWVEEQSKYCEVWAHVKGKLAAGKPYNGERLIATGFQSRDDAEWIQTHVQLFPESGKDVHPHEAYRLNQEVDLETAAIYRGRLQAWLVGGPCVSEDPDTSGLFQVRLVKHEDDHKWKLIVDWIVQTEIRESRVVDTGYGPSMLGEARRIAQNPELRFRQVSL